MERQASDPTNWIQEITSIVTHYSDIHPDTLRKAEDPARWSYGYLWWVWDEPAPPNAHDGDYDGYFEGAYSAMGTGGNFITVIPAFSVVVVHQWRTHRITRGPWLMSKGWTSLDIPSQCDKRAIVTGATSGIGWQAALELARAGALVIIPARTQEKADRAAERIRNTVPDAKLETASLDLTDLASVKAFAVQQVQDGRPLDILLNAGVMALPKRELTIDGFEMQFATNMLGHFALTGQLLPSLLQAPAPRVVSVSSMVHTNGGPIPIKDLNSEQSYKPMKAYSKTKLEVMLFARELQRRAGGQLLSVSCHSGYARTSLQFHKPSILIKAASLASLSLSQNASKGAQPSLFAATSPDAKPAGYYGPSSFFGFKGPVRETKPSQDTYDEAAAQQLFDELEQLSSIHYDF